MSLSITIPDQHYVGFQFRDNDIYPLAFSTPYSEDQAGKKRQSTVDNWARNSKVKVPAKIFKNVPMVGFEIRKSVRHSFSRSKIERWRIIDPRGFELEISNTNMTLIIESCIIDNGEIIDSCVWAREGQDNVLLPTSCDEYRNATKNTSRVNKKVSMSDVKLGDTVTFKNGTRGRYLGKYYKITLDTENDRQVLKCSSAKLFVFESVDGKSIQQYTTVHISTIDKSDPITDIEAEKHVNEVLNSEIVRYRYSGTVVAYASKAIKGDIWKVTEIKFPTFEDAIKSKHFSIVANYNQSQYMLCDLYYLRNPSFQNSTSGEIIASDEYEQNKVIKHIMEKSTSYYGRGDFRKKAVRVDVAHMQNFKLTSLEYQTTSALGNLIKICM